MAWKDDGNDIHHLQFGSMRARLEKGGHNLAGHWVLSCPGLMRPTSIGLDTEDLHRIKDTAVVHLMELLTAASEELGKAI